MLQRFILALIGVAAVSLGLGCTAQPVIEADYLGTYKWSLPEENFGGFSGLEIAPDGDGFVAITDRGYILQGQLQRDGQKITGVTVTDKLHALKNTKGEALGRYKTDSEGLAIAEDGRIYVSFEAEHYIWSYSDSHSNATPLPQHPDFKGFQTNSSLEALAIDADGAIYTMPERSGALDRPFQVYRYADDEWTKPFGIQRRGAFLPVGADFGPDGKLYLLERALKSIFGFQTRVRRYSVEGKRLFNEEILIETPSGRHDNMEGMSVWQDGAGDIRITLISDDNFRMLQSTQFVEYRLKQ